MTTPRHQRPTNLKQFLFGCPYYPEHWEEDVRRDDPARMAAAGVNVVRMGEFAWDLMEPVPGKFDFSLFDETIQRLGAVGVKTIFCTPTACPPRWLTAGHPELMRVDDSGRRMEHGSRQHVCTNNEEFRAQSRRITSVLAEHFAQNPNVIGWQTDNEFYCHFSLCHCNACEAGFRDWLRAKYHNNIDALNKAWGTAFWSQTYNDFDQIPLPFTGARPCYSNPSHELDRFRYVSDSVIEFQRQQVHILRAARGEWFITHNGLMGHIDYWKFTEDLDFLGADVYPGFGTGDAVNSIATSYGLAKARSAGGNFIVPEQESGPGGQKPYMLRTSPPGVMRLWAYQSIAHGADGMMHFRWRTCRFGAEEYWCGVLDHDNLPRRRYQEFSQEGAELKRIGSQILGTTVDVQAAVLCEFEADYAHETMPHGLPAPGEQGRLAYDCLSKLHLPCGVVQTHDSFEGLKFLLVPSMDLMDQVLAGKLAKFVEGGGTLFVGGRSAIKDRNNHVIAQTPPGLLATIVGCTVEEYGKLEPGTLGLLVAGRPMRGGPWYEILQPRGAQVLSTWQVPDNLGPWAADNQPAITINRCGKGMAIYCGTMLTQDNAAGLIGLALEHAAGLAPLAQCDHGDVEIVRRQGQGRKLLFVLNHSRRPQTVRGVKGRELITDRPIDGHLELPAFEVAVIREE
jgi:beta-galactosidase